jgi:hypothetical protein
MSRSSDADLDMLAELSTRLHVRDKGSCAGDEPLRALPTGVARFP